jgi:hypothetical protein
MASIGDKIQSELGSVQGNEFNFPFNVTSRFELNQVAQSEVVQIISSLSSDKATGIDTIDIRTLKIAVGVHSVLESITYLINLSIEQSICHTCRVEISYDNSNF